MRLQVDEDCNGHGRCYALAPQLLTPDDEGYVTIRGSEIEVPAGLEGLADELEGTCPEGAIRLVE